MYSESKKILWDRLLSGGQFFGHEFECDREIEGFVFSYWSQDAHFGINVVTEQKPRITAKDRRILLSKGIKVISITPDELHSDFSGTEKFITEEFTSFARTNCGT